MGLACLIFGTLITVEVVAGLWVDYQCNWKKKPELRGFDVLPPAPSQTPAEVDGDPRLDE